MNKKIKIILLLNIIIIELAASDYVFSQMSSPIPEEVRACGEGLKARSGARGVNLLDGTEPNGPCSVYSYAAGNGRKKAACIFGYNSNSGFYADNSTWRPNGIIMSNSWTSGNLDLGDLRTMPMGDWFGVLNSANSSTGWLNGVPVCDYGYNIGWGLYNNDLDPSSQTFNYRNTYQKPFNTDYWTASFPILDVLWGQAGNIKSSVNLPNHAQLINLEYNNSAVPNNSDPNSGGQVLQGFITGQAAIQRIYCLGSSSDNCNNFRTCLGKMDGQVITSQTCLNCYNGQGCPN